MPSLLHMKFLFSWLFETSRIEKYWSINWEPYNGSAFFTTITNNNKKNCCVIFLLDFATITAQFCAFCLKYLQVIDYMTWILQLFQIHFLFTDFFLNFRKRETWRRKNTSHSVLLVLIYVKEKIIGLPYILHIYSVVENKEHRHSRNMTRM